MPRSASSLSAVISALETAELEIITTGQSVSEDGTTRTLADLDKIRTALREYQRELDGLQGNDITFAHGHVSGLGGAR